MNNLNKLLPKVKEHHWELECYNIARLKLVRDRPRILVDSQYVTMAPHNWAEPFYTIPQAANVTVKHLYRTAKRIIANLTKTTTNISAGKALEEWSEQ